MNVLEHWIEEVYEVKTVDTDDGDHYVIVDMMVNCWGNKTRVQRRFNNMKEFNETKKQGYYLA